MKVRYIGIGTSLFSCGEVYRVLEESEHFYRILDNGDIVRFVGKHLFEVVKKNEDIKELTLKEALNYPIGTNFKMRFDDWKERYIEVEFVSSNLYYNNIKVVDMYGLKNIVNAKFILIDAWKEISYYDAYTSNKQVKFVVNDVEQIGTHYGILSELNSQGKDIKELLYQGKWYIREN